MSKEFKIPQYTPLQLNSNISYGLTKENNISKDELDSVQWLCEAYEHQIKPISDLEQQLSLTEKALEMACEEINRVEAKFGSAYIRANGYLVDYFKTKAKEMMKSE